MVLTVQRKVQCAELKSQARTRTRYHRVYGEEPLQAWDITRWNKQLRETRSLLQMPGPRYQYGSCAVCNNLVYAHLQWRMSR